MVENLEGLFVILPKKIELQVKHQGDHGKFLNLNIKEGTLLYKSFDKRESFPFSIVRLRHIGSNIPQNAFYFAIKGEFLRIARSILCLRDFKPKAKKFLERMKK